MSESEWLARFKQRLQNKLKAKEMTQRDLALVSGLSDSTVSDAVRGVRIPSLKTIINISQALDMDASDLIDIYDYII